MTQPKINLVELSHCPIFDQLTLEEALLRADDQNWCIINQGTPDAIVLGISSDPEEMIQKDCLQNRRIPIIKRFSGGGTVYVDQKTLFITFICNKEDTLAHCYPEPILRWGRNFYHHLFKHDQFNLIENDYVMGHQKIGGNALYIRKDRWLLHTSFLWDFDIKKINQLKHPPKTPDYRKGRTHQEFITSLNRFYPSLGPLLERAPKALSELFEVDQRFDHIPEQFLKKEHRKTLRLL